MKTLTTDQHAIDYCRKVDYGCDEDATPIEAYIAGGKNEHRLLTKWRDPDNDPPQHSNRVIVKLSNLLFTGGWYSDGSEPLDGGEGWSHDLQQVFHEATVVGWREVVD